MKNNTTDTMDSLLILGLQIKARILPTGDCRLPTNNFSVSLCEKPLCPLWLNPPPRLRSQTASKNEYRFPRTVADLSPNT
jgi:hypothetical protein